jgi:hypothetical protein
MTNYRPPLADIRLVLDEIADIAAICELPDFEHVDPETVDGVLDELGRFVAEVVAPVTTGSVMKRVARLPTVWSPSPTRSAKRGTGTSSPGGGPSRRTRTTGAEASRAPFRR